MTMKWLLLIFLQALSSKVTIAAPAPELHKEVIAGTQVLWQAPLQPKAVLLVTHATDRKPTDFFPKSVTCPDCLGYPEEVNITRTALKEGYILIIPQSANNTWAGVPEFNPWDSSDVARVIAVLHIIQTLHGWTGLPVYGLGICSGYNFLSVLALDFPLKAISGQLTTLVAEEGACSWSPKCSMLVSRADGNGLQVQPGGLRSLPFPYPPVMMVYMTRDRWTADRVGEWGRHLQTKGIRVKSIEVYPMRVDADLLRSKLPALSAEAAKVLMARFKKHGMLDAEGFTVMHKSGDKASCDGYIPEEWTWGLDEDPALQQAEAAGVEMSQILEVLTRAHACHEAVSSTTGDTFQWFNEASPIPA